MESLQQTAKMAHYIAADAWDKVADKSVMFARWCRKRASEHERKAKRHYNEAARLHTARMTAPSATRAGRHG
ncbi:MAG: hypothetical protein K0S68_1156 [Candidatus Saccharibacteria bacterium]|nr:hypothetical protein [Candidatus Saccharibacteria bacterium]